MKEFGSFGAWRCTCTVSCGNVVGEVLNCFLCSFPRWNRICRTPLGSFRCRVLCKVFHTYHVSFLGFFQPCVWVYPIVPDVRLRVRADDSHVKPLQAGRKLFRCETKMIKWPPTSPSSCKVRQRCETGPECIRLRGHRVFVSN